MKLYIKNMVCDRCILVVKQELEKLNIKGCIIKLGEIESKEEFTIDQKNDLRNNLEKLGFELLDSNTQQVIEKIKNIIINQIHHSEEYQNVNLSDILSKSFNRDYSYLSSLFSGVEHITIEKFVIRQRIEKAKELIIYDQLNLSEISDKLGYSSVSHLSNQFKKITGLTPTHFKQVGLNKRKPLDKV